MILFSKLLIKKVINLFFSNIFFILMCNIHFLSRKIKRRDFKVNIL